MTEFCSAVLLVAEYFAPRDLLRDFHHHQLPNITLFRQGEALIYAGFECQIPILGLDDPIFMVYYSNKHVQSRFLWRTCRSQCVA